MLASGIVSGILLEFDTNHQERSKWWTVLEIDFKNQQVKAKVGENNHPKLIDFSRIISIWNSSLSINLISRFLSDQRSATKNMSLYKSGPHYEQRRF